MDAHEREYAGAVAEMQETYGAGWHDTFNTPQEDELTPHEFAEKVCSTAIGKAYVCTAVYAALMGISLAHSWNTYGKRKLQELEQEKESR